jgi:hypothetical protein
MKKLIIIISAIGALTIFGFTSIQKQQEAGPTYITVSYSSNDNKIYTYAGGESIEPVKFKATLFSDDGSRNKVMDVLNGLYTQGYEIISSDHVAYRDGNHNYDVVEYNYLLKKRASNN